MMLYPSHFYSNTHMIHILPSPAVLFLIEVRLSNNFFDKKSLRFWTPIFSLPLLNTFRWVNMPLNQYIPPPHPYFFGGRGIFSQCFFSQFIVFYLTVDPHNVAGSSTSPNHKGPRQFHWLGYLTIAKPLQKKNIQLLSNNTKVNSLFGVNLVTTIF